MFSLISVNDKAKAKFDLNTGKVAISSVIIAIIVGIVAYNLMDGPGSFLPKTPFAGYICGGMTVLFIFDAIKYTRLYYKASEIQPSQVQGRRDAVLQNGYLVAIDHYSSSHNRLDIRYLRTEYGILQERTNQLDLHIKILPSEATAMGLTRVDEIPPTGTFDFTTIPEGALDIRNVGMNLRHVRVLKVIEQGVFRSANPGATVEIGSLAISCQITM